MWDIDHLLRASVLRFLRARNRQGFDIYLLPYAEHGNAGYILLDLDHPIVDVVSQMQAHGHEPCVVLQTSRGHLQAWIRVSTTPLEPAVATFISRQLAHTYGGDWASTDWRHLGRLAGFTNQKWQRRTASGFPPWVKIVHARPTLASAAQELLRSAMPVVAQHPTPALQTAIQTRRHSRHECSISTKGAARIYQTWLNRWHISKRFPQVDWSIVDLWLARKLLAIGISPSQVEAIISLGSPDFPRQHGNPQDYLRRTLAQAAALPAPRTVCSTNDPLRGQQPLPR
jgi:hypothetical protein